MGDIVNFWPALVFGWPAVILALALAAWGITKRTPLALVLAAVMVLPFSFYLAGSPRLGWMAALAPLLIASAAVAVRHRRGGVAWFLFAPVVALATWLALLVATQ